MYMSGKFGKREREISRITTNSFNKFFEDLWREKTVPNDGWSEQLLEGFMIWLACQDSNNRSDVVPVGAGEREGRVVCPLVRRLHFNMSHGIGRSGNLTEIQPKAIGSSMLNCLANQFALQILKSTGIYNCKGALVVPMATGMSLALCLGSWRRKKPLAKYVVWLRVDQKSCLKSILTAGFEPIVVDPIHSGDSLVSNVGELQKVLSERPSEILAVLSTASAFSPREPDDLVAIGKLCKDYDIFHLVNNAYGLQSVECIKRIEKSGTSGRIDAFVQSLDKNFLVPVGGAVIGTFKACDVENISSFYAGRASAIPSRDLVLTTLFLGMNGFNQLFAEQRQLFSIMKHRLIVFAEKIGERVLEVDTNVISLAMTLKTIPVSSQTLFGSILFSRGITGARVISSSAKVTTIEGCNFINFGSHSNVQHNGYLNIACGLGCSESEISQLFIRLEKEYTEFVKRIRKNGPEENSSLC